VVLLELDQIGRLRHPRVTADTESRLVCACFKTAHWLRCLIGAWAVKVRNPLYQISVTVSKE